MVRSSGQLAWITSTASIQAEDSPFPQGFRGHWENQDTFVVDSILLGQMVQATYRIQFSGDAIHILRQEKYSGSEIELNGTLDPATE